MPNQCQLILLYISHDMDTITRIVYFHNYITGEEKVNIFDVEDIFTSSLK